MTAKDGRGRWPLALAWPGWREWAFAGLLLAVFAAVAVPFGLMSGFLVPGRMPPWPSLAAFAAVAVVVPCLAEEMVFRVALLPREGPWLGWAALSVALFVAWHPLNAALFLSRAWGTFTDARFLLLAGLLGMCCTAAYLRSGSVWPGVAIHWAAVVGWKMSGGPLELFVA